MKGRQAVARSRFTSVSFHHSQQIRFGGCCGSVALGIYASLCFPAGFASHSTTEFCHSPRMGIVNVGHAGNPRDHPHRRQWQHRDVALCSDMRRAFAAPISFAARAYTPGTKAAIGHRHVKGHDILGLWPILQPWRCAHIWRSAVSTKPFSVLRTVHVAKWALHRTPLKIRTDGREYQHRLTTLTATSPRKGPWLGIDSEPSV